MTVYQVWRGNAAIRGAIPCPWSTPFDNESGAVAEAARLNEVPELSIHRPFFVKIEEVPSEVQ